MEERPLVGNVTEPVRHHDLLNVTMICLGSPEGARYGGLLRMLEVLFKGRCTPGQVIQILEEEYDFSSARNMEGTVTAVCNLSQGFIEEGRERGMKEGRERGMREGRAQGADQERLRSIRSLMETTGWPVDQVMAAMKIPVEEYAKYRKLLLMPQ